jgi:hypothetical protein
MRLIEGIFYTNLDNDVSAFIAKIRQKENIDEYTIFVIYYESGYECIIYDRYWKHHDCLVLRLDDDTFPQFSNSKYCIYSFVNYEEFFDIWDLLEKYIKFRRIDMLPPLRNIKTSIKLIPVMSAHCKLPNNLDFALNTDLMKSTPLIFKHKYYTTEEFITEIQENYPEFYKYDYSQIKPAICE